MNVAVIALAAVGAVVVLWCAAGLVVHLWDLAWPKLRFPVVAWRARRRDRIYSSPDRFPRLTRFQYRLGVRIMGRQIKRYRYAMAQLHEEAMREDPDNVRREGVAFGRFVAADEILRCSDVGGIMSGDHRILRGKRGKS